MTTEKYAKHVGEAAAGVYRDLCDKGGFLGSAATALNGELTLILVARGVQAEAIIEALGKDAAGDIFVMATNPTRATKITEN